ncbi:MAG: tetratricopeptide repeat protein [Verrucomicrobiota bacterium]
MKAVLLIFSVLGTLFISGCSSTKSQLPSERDGVTTSSSDAALEKRSEAFARFATGISYEINEQSDRALQEFYQAALADPAHETLALELARRFLKKKEAEKAVEVLSRTAARPQASGSVFSSLARSYLAIGKTNLAVNASQTAIKKSPQLISGYQTLTEIFLQAGQTNEAIKLLNSAARPTNSDALFLINLGELYGNVFRAQPKGAEAVKQRGLDVLNRAAVMKPANPNIRQKLADNFAQLGDIKNAAEIYLQMLDEFREVPPMRDALREKLANLYLQSSDKTKASEQLEAIVRDSPTRYPEAWYYLGAFAYDAKNYAKAAEYFGRALIVNPELEQAYYELANVQITIDQPGEALKTLEKARAKFSNSFSVEFFTGLAFARLKNYPEALKHFSAAEMIGNTGQAKRLNHFFYFQLGATFERNHDYTQAEKYFNKCLELSPDFAEALNYLGFMWTDRGVNLEKAHALIEKAVKLEPKNAAFIDSLGWVLFKLNQHEPALEYLLKAVELSKEPDAAVYDHIGDVYRAMKQNEKAHEAWQKSLAIEPSEEVRKKLQANSSSL